MLLFQFHFEIYFTSRHNMHDRKKEYKIQLCNSLQCKDHYRLSR